MNVDFNNEERVNAFYALLDWLVENPPSGRRSTYADFAKEGGLPEHVIKSIASRRYKRLDRNKDFVKFVDFVQTKTLSYAYLPKYVVAMYEEVFGVFPDIANLSVTAEKWIAIEGEVAELAVQISHNIGRLTALIEQSHNIDVLSDVRERHKKELLKILKTAVSVLESPIVEKGLVNSARDAVVAVGKEAAKKEGVDMIRSSISDLVELFSKLMDKIT